MENISSEAEKRVEAILKIVAVRNRPCACCGVMLYFLLTASGKLAPYSKSGLNHFADCPQADQFRMPRAK